MAIETPPKQFYKHDAYTACHYALYIALEQWLSDTVFRKDITRVFLASDEYAFRRRFELTDTSENYNDVQASSLHFPFANYWPLNAGWKPDERAAANTAAMVIKGTSERTRMLRAMAVTCDIGATFYFDREEDARLAYELLLWAAFRERFMYTTVQWKQEILGIPLNVKLQDLSFNPDRTESDWLKEQRVFTISARIELRSHIPQPPEQPEYTSDIAIDSDERYTLTERVILNMLSEGKLLSELEIDTLFNQNPEIVINQYGVASTTHNSARVTWDVSAPDIDFIQLLVPGRDPVIISDVAIRDYTFRGLEQDSTYVVTIQIMDKNGVSKSSSIKFTTPLSPEAEKKKTSEPDTLVGVSW